MPKIPMCRRMLYLQLQVILQVPDPSLQGFCFARHLTAVGSTSSWRSELAASTYLAKAA